MTLRNAIVSMAATGAAYGLLVGCGEKSPEREASGGGAPASDEREFIVPGTAHEVPADDPSGDGWDSEALGAEVGKALKKIAAAIVEGEGWEPKVSAFEAPGFEFAALVPLRRAKETVSAGVSQWVPEGELASEDTLAGGMRELLLDCGIEGAPDRFATKVVSVEPLRGGDLVRCVVIAQLAGRDGSSFRQLQAEWETVSSVSADGARLVSLRGTGPLAVSELGRFSDVTHAALGQVPEFAEQFYRGQDHWAGRIEMLSGIDVGGWQGLAAADVNGDGLDDLYVSQPGGLPNRLYVAKADGTFTDRSSWAGVDFLDSSHASLFADLDNDGDADLIAGVSHGVLVMENDGTGKFTPRRPKLLPAALPYSIAAADVDRDGDLDFYVSCYNRRPGVNRHHVFARPVPYHDANNGGRNALFRNDGGWKFTDVTVRSGMDVRNRRYSYAAAWEDFDNDGDLDLYVANDFGRNNLYRNDTPPGGAATFTEVAEAAGVVDVGPGMSACWGDFDDDGLPDLYVSNMFSSAGHRITTQGRFHKGADAETLGHFMRHARGNSLFANRGGGRFGDVGEDAGVTLGRWAWGSNFADLNSDGRLDIVVANGFISQRSADDL